MTLGRKIIAGSNRRSEEFSQIKGNGHLSQPPFILRALFSVFILSSNNFVFLKFVLSSRSVSELLLRDPDPICFRKMSSIVFPSSRSRIIALLLAGEVCGCWSGRGKVLLGQTIGIHETMPACYISFDKSRPKQGRTLQSSTSTTRYPLIS